MPFGQLVRPQPLLTSKRTTPVNLFDKFSAKFAGENPQVTHTYFADSKQPHFGLKVTTSCDHNQPVMSVLPHPDFAVSQSHPLQWPSAIDHWPSTFMQLKDVLRAAIMRLEDSRVGSSRLNAEILLMHTLGCDRAYLYAHPERELIEEELARYDEHLSERARGVPAQYITGHQEFWGLDFLVAPGVLIPRPETEHLVEAVLELVRAHELKRPRIVDV